MPSSRCCSSHLRSLLVPLSVWWFVPLAVGPCPWLFLTGFYIKAAPSFKKRQSPPFSAGSRSRESSWSCKATKDLATLSILSVKSLDSVWWKVVDEAILPIPMPIPAVIPRLTSRDINWVALFDHGCAVRGTVRVWLLETIFIWGVRKAKVQIPIHWQADMSKHLSHKEKALMG